MLRKTGRDSGVETTMTYAISIAPQVVYFGFIGMLMMVPVAFTFQLAMSAIEYLQPSRI
jgi:hypothetical protein